MKVSKVELKELAVEDFKVDYTKENTYPALLTNYALEQGYRLGIIESSIWTEINKYKGFMQLVHSGIDLDNTNENDPKTLEILDDIDLEVLDITTMLPYIYLAIIGANPNIELTYDKFLMQYHLPINETFELFGEIISNMMPDKKNNFAKSLKESTEKSSGKKSNNRKLK